MLYMNVKKMNISASNTILKFLEEPSDDVVAIFVTSNQFNILDTIKSRCQIIRLQYEDSSDISFSDDVLSFIEDINNRKSNDLLLKFNYYNNNLFKDKSMSISFIRELLKYYEILLNKKDGTTKLEEIINIVLYIR